PPQCCPPGSPPATPLSAASRETRREITVDGGVLPGPALRLCVETAGSFLYSERAAAGCERSQDGTRDAGGAAGDAAIAGGSPRNDTQHNGERNHRAGA